MKTALVELTPHFGSQIVLGPCIITLYMVLKVLNHSPSQGRDCVAIIDIADNHGWCSLNIHGHVAIIDIKFHDVVAQTTVAKPWWSYSSVSLIFINMRLKWEKHSLAKHTRKQDIYLRCILTQFLVNTTIAFSHIELNHLTFSNKFSTSTYPNTKESYHLNYLLDLQH